MADKDSAPAAAIGFAAVPLHANSYDFAELLKASQHAEGLKSADGQETALGKIADDLAIRQDVLEGQRNPGLPEGTELQEVIDQAGEETLAAVAVPGKDPAEKPAPVKN